MTAIATSDTKALSLPVTETVTSEADEAIFEMAQYICDNLNANVSNFSTTSYNKNDCFWIQGPTMWQNIISTSICLDHLF